MRDWCGRPASPTAGGPTSATTPPTGSFRSACRALSDSPLQQALQSAWDCALSKADTTGGPHGKSSSGTGRKAGGGLARPVQPSAELGAIIGNDPLPRSEVVSKVWDHIRKNNLQNPANKREILADDKLKKVFGKDSCTMFEMNKHLSNHLK